MILKMLTYSALLFSGLTKNSFYTARDDRHLKGLVSVHHIIPRQFRNHPVIKISKYEKMINQFKEQSEPQKIWITKKDKLEKLGKENYTNLYNWEIIYLEKSFKIKIQNSIQYEKYAIKCETQRLNGPITFDIKWK